MMATPPSATPAGGFNYIFVGNPGVGKSTILNGMMKSMKFKSGTNIAEGLTFKLQIERVGPDTYMDTPGLSCIKMRKQAAVAIKEALQKGGLFKVCFLVTLEAGRVRPDDVTTMRLVLEAAPEITKYALVVNKVSKPMYKQLMDPEIQSKLLDGFFTEAKMTRTDLIHINPHDPALHDESDVLAELPSGLQSFLENMPSVEIRRQNVKDIKHDEFERLKEEHSVKIEAISHQLEETIRKWKASEEERKRECKREPREAQSDEAPPAAKRARKGVAGCAHVHVFFHLNGEINHVERDLPTETNLFKYNPGRDGVVPEHKAWVVFSEEGMELNSYGTPWCKTGIRRIRNKIIKDAQYGKTYRIVFPKHAKEPTLELYG